MRTQDADLTGEPTALEAESRHNDDTIHLQIANNDNQSLAMIMDKLIMAMIKANRSDDARHDSSPPSSRSRTHDSPSKAAQRQATPAGNHGFRTGRGAPRNGASALPGAIKMHCMVVFAWGHVEAEC